MLKSPRKWVPALIASIVLLSIVGPAAADLPPGGTFVDDDGSAHERAIEAIFAAGITSGCNPPANDRFCPKNRVTRGQMAAFLVRALDLPPTTQSPFTDTAGTFHDDINRIAAAGITSGCTATQFCPGQRVTRAQLAAFLVRALDLPPTTQSPFTDTAGTFHDDINRIAAAGITSGCNPPANDRFCPQEQVTRGQMATFLTRGLDLPIPSIDESKPNLSSDSRSWELVFSDNFNGQNLDTGNWTDCYWWDQNGCTNGGNNELEWYTADSVTVSGGALRLTARPETIHASDGATYPYKSGMVTTGRDYYLTNTPPRFEFTYGFAEAHIKVPSGKGLWPAFWMLPSDHESTPEIDIMEIVGQAPDVYEAHVHYYDRAGNYHQPGEDYRGPDFSAGWHTFAVDWQPGLIVWYVDGIERWRFIDHENIFSEPSYLLLNLAVGGDWTGAPDADTEFPATMQIDYVRVWKEQG